MRPGYSLLELLVALSLAGLIASAALGLLASQSVIARKTVERGRRNEAIRTASLVLGTELRWVRADQDLHALTGDSLALRAFRGAGVVCALDAAGALVRYRGVRQPDPAKDSVLIVRDTMTEIATALSAASAGSGGCAAGADETLERFQTEVMPRVGDAVTVFEAGTYYLTGRALRYRLGAEGRQPVTADLFDDRQTRFGLALDTAFAEALLSTRPALHAGRASARFRFHFP